MLWTIPERFWYKELLRGYDRAADGELLELVAKARFNEIIAMEQLGRRTEVLGKCEEFSRHYSGSKDLAIQEMTSKVKQLRLRLDTEPPA